MNGMEQWDDMLFPVGNTKLDLVMVDGIALQPGDQVKLRPLSGADALDIVLAGKIATIESIEQDYEDRIYVAVTVDDDPGKEWGMMRQPGHRFFYSPTEIEPLVREGKLS